MTGLAPLEETRGELRQGGSACHGCTLCINNTDRLGATPDTPALPTVMLSTPIDIDLEMDISYRDSDNSDSDNDDGLPCAQSSLPKDGLKAAPERKTRLRRKLLRADHHRVFLSKCHKAKVTPKDLRLSRQVHPIQVVGTREMWS